MDRLIRLIVVLVNFEYLLRQKDLPSSKLKVTSTDLELNSCLDFNFVNFEISKS